MHAAPKQSAPSESHAPLRSEAAAALLPGARAMRAVFVALMAVWALWTLLVQGGIVFGWSFATVCRMGSIVTVAGALAVGAWWAAGRRGPRRAPAAEWDAEARLALGILAALAVLCALVASGVVRRSWDDWHYLLRPAFVLAHPDTPLSVRVPAMPGVSESFFLYKDFPYCIEFFWAYAARLLGVHLLDVYFVLVPPVLAALVPAAWYLAFGHFTRRPLAAAGAAALVCCFLAVTAQTRGDFGSYTLIRIWQNKNTVVTIFFPLLVCGVLRQLSTPSLRGWLELVLLVTAAAGFGINTLFLLPPFVVVLVAAALLDRRLAGRPVPWPAAAAACAALAYLGIEAVYYFRHADPNFGGWMRTTQEGKFPQLADFWTNMGYVFAGPFSVTTGFVVGVASAVLCAWACRGWRRRFPLLWGGLVLVLILNPVAYHLFVRYSPGGYIISYWRLAHLLPLPLLVGACALPWLDRLAAHPRRAGVAIAFVLLLAVALNLARVPGTVVGTNPVALGAYKMDPGEHADVQRLLREAPPGPMLAPEQYSRPLPVFDPRFTQTVTAQNMLMHYANQSGNIDVVQRRVAAQQYVSTGAPGDAGACRAVLADLRPASVVVAGDALRAAHVGPTLRHAGYRPRVEHERYRLFVRADLAGTLPPAPAEEEEAADETPQGAAEPFHLPAGFGGEGAKPPAPFVRFDPLLLLAGVLVLLDLVLDGPGRTALRERAAAWWTFVGGARALDVAVTAARQARRALLWLCGGELVSLGALVRVGLFALAVTWLYVQYVGWRMGLYQDFGLHLYTARTGRLILVNIASAYAAVALTVALLESVDRRPTWRQLGIVSGLLVLMILLLEALGWSAVYWVDHGGSPLEALRIVFINAGLVPPAVVALGSPLMWPLFLFAVLLGAALASKLGRAVVEPVARALLAAFCRLEPGWLSIAVMLLVAGWKAARFLLGGGGAA